MIWQLLAAFVLLIYFVRSHLYISTKIFKRGWQRRTMLENWSGPNISRIYNYTHFIICVWKMTIDHVNRTFIRLPAFVATSCPYPVYIIHLLCFWFERFFISFSWRGCVAQSTSCNHFFFFILRLCLSSKDIKPPFPKKVLWRANLDLSHKLLFFVCDDDGEGIKARQGEEEKVNIFVRHVVAPDGERRNRIAI